MNLRDACGHILLAVLAWAAYAGTGTAQILQGFGANDGITVSGTGEVSARPNLVEIDLQVSGKAELTGDALVKYRDAKKRVLEALDSQKIENMAVSEHGLAITVGNSPEQQQRIMQGNLQALSKPQVEVSSNLRISLNEVRDTPPEELIKTIGRLLDVAQDAGVTVGPTAAELMRQYRYGQQAENNLPVRFILADLVDLREKAYEQAVSDARDRASRLAKLHHVKLGSALSIQEIAVGGDRPAAIVSHNNQLNTNMAAPEDDGPRIVSSSLADVPVQVRLMVRFAIVPADPATAQN